MAKSHIFVANDRWDYLELMKDLLEGEGYKVTLFLWKTNAFQEIKACSPDLVILDLGVAHPNRGWVTLNRLKLDLATAPLPVILCSANIRSRRNKGEHLERMGCYVVEKPFDIDTMLDAISQALSHKQGLTSP